MSSLSEKNIVPAPWTLSGKGYILLYFFKKDFVLKNRFIDNYLTNKFVGGLGTVMIVDYKRSNAGPYGELLFIPGKFKINNKKRYSITKIYVSTYKSIYSGRANWAIPKEMAEFKFWDKGQNEEIVVKKDSTEFFKAKIKKYKVFFPITTYLLPFPIFQLSDGKVYYTNFHGYGIGRLCKLIDIMVDHQYFPDISKERLLLTIEVNPFKITFPKAQIEEFSF